MPCLHKEEKEFARIQDLMIQNVQKNLASVEDILDLYIKLFGG